MQSLFKLVKNCTTVVDYRLASDFLKNLEHLGHHILMLLL